MVSMKFILRRHFSNRLKMVKELTEEQSQAHIILAYNLQINLNEFFVEYPKEKMGKKEFMDIQLTTWKAVKKELKIR